MYCVISFDHLVLFSVWISMLSDDVILFSFLIPSLYCDFWSQRLKMISWIFQIQLCIKVILLGTPAQKQRPKPREGAEKCVQDSLRKASRRLDLFKRPRKEKQVPRRNQPRGWFNKVLPLIWFYVSHIQNVMIFFYFPKYMSEKSRDNLYLQTSAYLTLKLLCVLYCRLQTGECNDHGSS